MRVDQRRTMQSAAWGSVESRRTRAGRKNITPLPHLGIGSFWLRLRNSNRVKKAFSFLEFSSIVLSPGFFLYPLPQGHLDVIFVCSVSTQFPFVLSPIVLASWPLDFLSRASRPNA